MSKIVPLPMEVSEMSVPQLVKLQKFMLGKMTDEQEKNFRKELQETKQNKKRKAEEPIIEDEEIELKASKGDDNEDNETTTPILDEEEMKIFQDSKVYDDEDDETNTPKTPLEKTEKDMDMFKEAAMDEDFDDFMQKLDKEGGKRRRTRKGGRKHKKHATKKHHKKSKTHKKRRMHKKRRTHRRR